MGAFRDRFAAMAEGINDLARLDVVTISGTVTLEAADKVTEFDQVMAKATGNTEVKARVLASTKVMLDGDITVFYDKNITTEQTQAHAELVEIGMENRKATITMIKDILGEVADL